MRLADFIESHYEQILAEWDAFAAQSSSAGRAMNDVARRDHALAMLTTMVADLRTPQTVAEGIDKSRGNSDSPPEDPATPAEVHGSGRAQSGFSVGEMVSEYRALRASVARLWLQDCDALKREDFADLLRFNEAIDQAIAESITRYSADVDYSREMFLAILGHDLRSPLNAVLMASEFMVEESVLPERERTLLVRIARSGRRMSGMISDLLDFTRGRLGEGIPVTRDTMNLGAAAQDVIDEITLTNPGQAITLNASGSLSGSWDCARLSQVVANLVGNAVAHGTGGTAIEVTAQGEAADVVLRVHNFGAVIPPDQILDIFSPFKRVRAGEGRPISAGSLGLGLYIAERIVTAHGGSIHVRSSAEAGTLFTVRLPR